MKKHRTTEEEMEGPTSSWGSRNSLICLTLQEHDDDDDDDDDEKVTGIMEEPSSGEANIRLALPPSWIHTFLLSLQ